MIMTFVLTCGKSQGQLPKGSLLLNNNCAKYIPHSAVLFSFSDLAIKITIVTFCHSFSTAVFSLIVLEK